MRGTVRTYLASLEDLTLKVMGVSSAVASSAMVGIMCGGEDDRQRKDDLRYLSGLSDEDGMKSWSDAVVTSLRVLRIIIC